ncbi:hypothetical protein DBR36_09855 [Microbacterium sp. HMWF026]|nr:hypothetical protein DBR36_09855 [Microbacterium sp. HMWF026]
MSILHARNLLPRAAQPRNRVFRQANQWLTSKTLSDESWDLVISYDPFSAPLVARLRYKKLVYDCVDAYEYQPQYASLESSQMVKEAELEVAHMADVRIATSQTLARRRGIDWKQPVALLEGAHEMSATSISGRRNEGRRALYIGAFDSYKIDAAALIEWLSSDSDRRLVMAGRQLAGADETLRDLLRHDRVAVREPVSGDQIKHLCEEADFGIVALQRTPYNLYSFPLKTWDYMMNGVPVLASNAPALHGISGVFNIRDEYLAAAAVDPQELVAVAASHHVDERLRRLQELL